MIILISLFFMSFIYKSECSNTTLLPFHTYELISEDLLVYKKTDDFEYNNFESVFELTIPSRTFRLCLKEINKPISENILSFSDFSNAIKLYTGILCDLKESEVSGTIVSNIFHGSIKMKNETFYVESINKYASLTEECGNCHSVIYSDNAMRVDIPNVTKLPQIEDFVEEPESNKIIFSRIPRQIDFERIYCDLTILIHESYISSCGSYLVCLATIMRHINKLNEALSLQIIINGSALIQYQISKVVKIYKTDTINDNVDEPKDLIHILSDFSEMYETCLTGMFVHSDWDNGNIGLALLGNSIGWGICNKEAVFVVNSKNQNSAIPENMHMITTIHEIGHTLGSIHDPDPSCSIGCYDLKYFNKCSPGNGKNFVMQQNAQKGDHSNNFKFSPCSIDNIINLATLPSRRTCLKKKSQSVCGNGIIEIGEQCDSGDIEDICCGSPLSAMPCKVIFGKCSPSQGSCCNSMCEFRNKTESCRKESVCTNIQACSGTSASCPTTSSKNEGKVCSSNFSVCSMGECAGLLCESFNKTSCKCPYPNDCKLCCQDNFNSTCKVFNDATNSTYNISKGSMCVDTFGNCDGNGRCIKDNPIVIFFKKLAKFFKNIQMLTLKGMLKSNKEWIMFGIFGCILLSQIIYYLKWKKDQKKIFSHPAIIVEYKLN